MSEERYQLTPYGYLSTIMDKDEAARILKNMYSFMKENYNAIVFEDWAGSFVNVEHHPPEWDEDDNEIGLDKD
jgi:hypothetical protein